MKIKKCHIQNFGKLSNVDYEFSDGLNVINQENGAGKSTLAAFIRIMFFGFANEGKRNDVENERKRYKPWQGGCYGGSIIFDVNGKLYKVSRIFGSKDKDDEFSLVDANTLLETTDFSSKLGEDILRIDHDSFCRTIYIAQNNCETESTDSINAKIGNLAENTDDINNFDTVNKKLLDKINALSATRKTGALNKLKKEISELEDTIRKGKDIDALYDNLNTMRNQEKGKVRALKNEQTELQNNIKKLSSYKEIKSKKEQYNDLCEQCKVRKSEYEKTSRYFKGNIPDISEIDLAIESSTRLNEYKNTMDIYSVNELNVSEGAIFEKQFREGMPDEHQIAETKRLINDINNIANYTNSTEYIDDDKVQKVTNKITVYSIVKIIVILSVIALAVVLCLFSFYSVAMVVVLFGLISILYIRNSLAHFKKQRAMYQIEKEQAQLIKTQKERYRDIKRDIEIFITRYGDGAIPNVQMYGTWMGDFEKNLHIYKQYKMNVFEYEKAKKNHDVCKDLLDKFFVSLEIEAGDDLRGKLQEIRDKAIECQYNKNEYDKAHNNMIKFEADNKDVLAQEVLTDFEDESLDVLNADLAKLTSQMNKNIQNISDYTLQIDRVVSDREQITEAEERLIQAKEEYEQLSKEYEIVRLTQKYLENAKIGFTARYMKPLMDGFNKYYKVMSVESDEKYIFDANMKLSVDGAGMSRDIKTLSQGYQDMTGICMRMALIDAMYEKEKPFVVFDDPFVNLDENKIQGGIDFLRKISMDYQIIYFTCHDSRV